MFFEKHRRSLPRLSRKNIIVARTGAQRSNDNDAPVAQPVEHVLGKDEVTGSKPVGGFLNERNFKAMRENIQFECTECRRINYCSTKDKKKKPERLEFKKFCRFYY